MFSKGDRETGTGGEWLRAVRAARERRACVCKRLAAFATFRQRPHSTTRTGAHDDISRTSRTTSTSSGSSSSSGDEGGAATTLRRGSYGSSAARTPRGDPQRYGAAGDTSSTAGSEWPERPPDRSTGPIPKATKVCDVCVTCVTCVRRGGASLPALLLACDDAAARAVQLTLHHDVPRDT
jgi:hypothetical protein